MVYYDFTNGMLLTSFDIQRRGYQGNLAALGIYPVRYERPLIDEYREELSPAKPVLENGYAVQRFVVRDLPEDSALSKREELRKLRLDELNEVFASAEASAHVTSRLGFAVDAHERAHRNVQGLIITMSAEDAPATVAFCDYENVFHDLSLADLQIIQREIIADGQARYAAKWAARNELNAASTIDELRNVVLELYPKSKPMITEVHESDIPA